mmetsp:Transcript_6661/g.9876  ORF Transcript_6661/g.9876 Transcript_6661/m.9876 type:complete len:215 (-) Transcript_6661:176-820(-)
MHRQRIEKWSKTRRCPQHVGHHSAAPGTKLDELNLFWTAQRLPGPDHPHSYDFAKHLADLRCRRKVTALAKDAGEALASVVAMLRVRHGQFHVLGHGHRAHSHAFLEQRDQRCLGFLLFDRHNVCLPRSRICMLTQPCFCRHLALERRLRLVEQPLLTSHGLPQRGSRQQALAQRRVCRIQRRRWKLPATGPGPRISAPGREPAQHAAICSQRH